jgi:protein phosphatase
MSVQAWGAVTDCGLVRAANEDALLADPPVFIVADGMGGHAAGDVASWMAVDAFVDFVGRPAISVHDAEQAIGAANAAIVDAALSDPGRAGMGTTLSGLASVVAGGTEHWMVFNVGDSRVYRLADGRLRQLTVDHSEAEEMVLAGQITREEARGHRLRNIVTRSLGTDPAPVADSWVFPPSHHDRFLVCSDGLTTEVPDDRIERCLLEHQQPQQAAEELLRLALAAGARDNVTVIVVDGTGGNAPDADTDTAPRGGDG